MVTDKVNIFQGTASVKRYSNGNTLPLVQMPNGMDAWTLQTRGRDATWFFHPKDQEFEGIRLTHQASPWIGDYGHFLFYPQTGIWREDTNTWLNTYSKEKSIFKPSYMKVSLSDGGISYEVLPLIRGGWHRITFPKGNNRLLIRSYDDYPDKDSFFHFDEDTYEVEGYTEQVHAKAHDKFKKYIFVKIEGDGEVAGFIFEEINEKATIMETLIGKTRKGGCCLEFDFTETTTINVLIGTSYISIDQAKENLKQEIQQMTFNGLKEKQNKIWHDNLSRITIETKSEDELKTFYSCMYRTLLFPNLFYEEDKQGKIYHYNPDVGQVYEGPYYTNIGLWDTFRTLFPLYALIRRKVYEEILEGFINQFKEVGWLPKWLAPGERGNMPGTLIDGVFADAQAKEIPFDIEVAIEGLLKHSTKTSMIECFGRPGIAAYLRNGYVPLEIKESVNQTLDYCYGDYAISQLLEVTGRSDAAANYKERSHGYQHLFDRKTGLMMGKHSNGEWDESFHALKWGEPYCEGGAYQNSFFIAHDFDFYIKLFEDKKDFETLLDTLFSTEPLFTVGSYEKEIHEMTEMANADFGQCAISNQPSFHIPYLYTLLRKDEKSAYWVRKILNEGFSWHVDGFPGDEDNGSMSAWFILSSIGLYPLVPGEDAYLSIYQHYQEIILHLENGKDFILKQGDKVHRQYSVHDIMI